MNKKVTLSIVFVAVAAISSILWLNNSKGNSYQPRNNEKSSPEGIFNYFGKMRNNQITGTVDVNDYFAVKADVLRQRNLQNKTQFPLQWQFAGPDNIGGRTRAILIDRNNSDTLYAGSVSGPIFKSDNRGASWYPLAIDNDGIAFVSLAQTNNNTIFAGTGETFVTYGANIGAEGTHFFGSGIYRSKDGRNFNVLTNTASFGYVAELVAHPTQNIIFAATQSGLRYSSDDGASWQLARSGACKRVKINKNGVLIANIGTTLWRSTNPTDASSYSIISGISAGDNINVAWSESDPDYCYVITSGSVNVGGFNQSGYLTGVFKSTDEGQTFTKIVNQTSSFFRPLGGVGWYACALAVHPRDRDHIYFGGLEFAQWTLSQGPSIVGNTNNGPTNPFGIHADKHIIVFDNKGDDPVMYVGTDGGVSQSTNAEMTRWRDRFINYTATQNYAISANPRGEVMGGTQDNDNILISLESYPRLIGKQMMTGLRIAGVTGSLGGDGFENAMSYYDQDIMFVCNQQGNLARINDGGNSPMSLLWDNRVRTAIKGNVYAATQYGFALGLHLWENPEAVEGKLLNGPSDYYDSIYKARLFMKLDNGIWMCNNATSSLFNADNPSNDNVRWFKLTNNIQHIVHFATTRDGNTLFAGSTSGTLYRIDGLNKANWDTTELVAADAISDSISLSNINGNMAIGGRHISSISVDPSDDNRVMVTLGNYGNSTFVYITENALDPVPTWTNIQSNLPRFPVYSGIISADDPSILILGTEYGVYACSNGYSNSPNWVDSRQDVNGNQMSLSPILDIVQVAEKPWTGHTIYLGTHGMGMWKSGSLLTSIKPQAKVNKLELNVFPNPASNSCKINSSIKGNYTLNVYDLNGRLVATEKGQSNGTITLSTSSMVNGNYFVELLGANSKAVSKLIVQH